MDLPSDISLLIALGPDKLVILIRIEYTPQSRLGLPIYINIAEI